MKPELAALVADLHDLETQIADMRTRIEDIAEAEEQPLRRGLVMVWTADEFPPGFIVADEAAPVTDEVLDALKPEPHTCETCAWSYWRVYDSAPGWCCTMEAVEGTADCARNWQSRKTGGAE